MFIFHGFGRLHKNYVLEATDMSYQIKNLDELPAILKVEDIQKVLRISRATAFNLTKERGFPAIRIGKKRIVIPRDRFLQWVENKAEGEIPRYSYNSK